VPLDKKTLRCETQGLLITKQNEPLSIREAAAIFFHPDYTVGTGIQPVQSETQSVQTRGLYRRSGITGYYPVHPALKI
jgi:hypothetical protein